MKFPKFMRIATVYDYQSLATNKTAALQDKPIYLINSKLINILSKIFDFSYAFVSPSDDDFGRLLPNGNWTGMVGMVYRDEADLIIDELSVTESRANVIDFSLPYHIDIWTFATRFTKGSHSNTSFLKPFTFQVWLAVVICFSFVTLVDYILWRKTKSEKILKICKLYSMSSGNTKDKCSYYVMKTSSLIAETLLRFFYVSVLLSVFVIPTSSNVRTIPELAKAVSENIYQCMSYNVYHLDHLLSDSQDSNFRTIGHSVGEYKGTHDIESAMAEKRSGKNIAYIGTESHLRSLKKMYFVSQDGFLPDLISIGMQKNFCCKEQIDSVLNYILASGLFKKYIEYDFFHKFIRPLLNIQDENVYKPLSVMDFGGLFLLAAIGYILSIVIFLFEVLVHKFKIKAS